MSKTQIIDGLGRITIEQKEEITRLRAENARLREAAEGVISWWNMDGALATCRDALEPLRAALKEGGA